MAEQSAVEFSGASGRPPTVSVIIPAYNGARFLREAIDSALAQTWKDSEVVVVDDGSTDETPSIIAAYGSRIRSLRRTNAGAAAALNAGIRATQGEWVAWLSQDDVWEPTKLARQMEVARADPAAGLIYTDYWKIDEAGRVLSEYRAAPPATPRRRMLRLIADCYINANSALFRRSVLERVGLFEEGQRWAIDLDLYFRILPEAEIRHVPEPLLRYRVHPGQETLRPHTADWAVARGVRRMGPLTGVAGVILYLGLKVLWLPMNLQKESHEEKMSLRQIARTFPRFILQVASPPG